MYKVAAVFILNFSDLKKLLMTSLCRKLCQQIVLFLLFLQKNQVVFGDENLNYTLTFVHKWCLLCIFQICECLYNIISSDGIQGVRTG